MESKMIKEMVNHQYFRFYRDSLGKNADAGTVVPKELRSRQARAIVDIFATIIEEQDKRIDHLEKAIRSIRL